MLLVQRPIQLQTPAVAFDRRRPTPGLITLAKPLPKSSSPDVAPRTRVRPRAARNHRADVRTDREGVRTNNDARPAPYAKHAKAHQAPAAESKPFHDLSTKELTALLKGDAVLSDGAGAPSQPPKRKPLRRSASAKPTAIVTCSSAPEDAVDLVSRPSTPVQRRPAARTAPSSPVVPVCPPSTGRAHKHRKGQHKSSPSLAAQANSVAFSSDPGFLPCSPSPVPVPRRRVQTSGAYSMARSDPVTSVLGKLNLPLPDWDASADMVGPSTPIDEGATWQQQHLIDSPPARPRQHKRSVSELMFNLSFDSDVEKPTSPVKPAVRKPVDADGVVYAGPAFHSSPSPGALPVPKFMASRN